MYEEMSSSLKTGEEHTMSTYSNGKKKEDLGNHRPVSLVLVPENTREQVLKKLFPGTQVTRS